ncbi:glycerate kinase [Schlesneria sp. DSM 10557]|uniref:glycerate kinase type-2 family protein n=1 Tax=Schlesneria sp. DSM 10557 TaxID=3044399 RepID=UPI0035A04B05
MTLQQQAEAIWRAGVAAVDSTALVRQAISADRSCFTICGETISLDSLRRLVVVGAGKAGAGMAAGVEDALGSRFLDKLTGWVNVPADCVRSLEKIHLHPARPAGVNEPTEAGVHGCQQILALVHSLTPDDLCLVLISGGGSALLPAPIEGVSLADKLAVTRLLMRSGATIHELNTVRKRLSRVKGGGLLRAAPAGRMIALIISDVPGDPLGIIASGPTVANCDSAQDALAVLERFAGTDSAHSSVPASVWNALRQQIGKPVADEKSTIECHNFVIGNNQTAVKAAAAEARRLGFEVRLLGTDRQGVASEIGVELAELSSTALREASSRSMCFLGGGEPVVKLAETDLPRVGGRNQEVALAAGCHWGNRDLSRLIVLSGGTDGEDGPTDAAGAFFDAKVQQSAQDRGLDPRTFLAINDSYTFFDQVGGLLKTGPTHTNVMDLQMALVAGESR